jgi:hypothetical protein
LTDAGVAVGKALPQRKKGLKPIDQRLIEYYKLRLSGSIRRTLLYSYSLVRGKVYNSDGEKWGVSKVIL